MGAVTSRIWGTSSADLKLDSVVKLSNGVTMPRLGFGVWQIDPAVCTSVVETALEAGYRHVDSAQAYRNEAEAGAALRSSSAVKRKDVFFTTKIPRDLGSVDANYASLVESVNKINGDGPDADAYVDLFLIHTPRMGPEGIKNVWQALERLLKEGKTRSIGVSNFNGENIQGMKEYATLNPWVQEKEITKYCEENGIVLQAYSPLENGRKLDDPTVGEIGKKYKKSPAQILIRYCLQKGWVPLPKSVHKERIVQNTQLYDFDISSEDMATLDGLDGK
ncbi:hypothetical protein KVR01_005838 [Diaporthe batatas]|uniref:uncharacterized protein n=1 Tax=Diaporthe batatas TaxID=748121 RepID=UPI001D04F674|nr:uncharacterized protein KVR01_005838 [Diaporthe batatas]KAG8163920.1 hypothetical protein KVR01_005838 [Diaporthe batatas]